MTENEKLLFFKLISQNKINEKEVGISDISVNELFGNIVLNRLSGITYKNLLEAHLLSEFPREFRVALSDLYTINVKKNESYYKSLHMLSDILSPVQEKYAALKGAYLCGYYPEGCRTSNDVDLLVADNEVSDIGNILCENGFEQGYVRNNIFIKASRTDIVSSKMLRGETVPYIKTVDLPYMKYLEVDLNFSSDYKQGNREKVKAMVNNSEMTDIKGAHFPALHRHDFFIHLCEHLYKEASTLPWIEMRRDMTLYKYYDIYYIINHFNDGEYDALFNRILALNSVIPCYYALWSCNSLFGFASPGFNRLCEKLKPDNCDFLHTVFDPSGKKVLMFTEKDLTKRFWHANRKELLKEI